MKVAKVWTYLVARFDEFAGDAVWEAETLSRGGFEETSLDDFHIPNPRPITPKAAMNAMKIPM